MKKLTVPSVHPYRKVVLFAIPAFVLFMIVIASLASSSVSYTEIVDSDVLSGWHFGTSA